MLQIWIPTVSNGNLRVSWKADRRLNETRITVHSLYTCRQPILPLGEYNISTFQGQNAMFGSA